MRTLVVVLASFILALHSVNAQWQTYYVANQNVTFVDVCVVNQNVVWAYGMLNPVVYKTTNGGGNWSNVSPNISYNVGYTISALDENIAWITTTTIEGFIKPQTAA